MSGDKGTHCPCIGCQCERERIADLRWRLTCQRHHDDDVISDHAKMRQARRIAYKFACDLETTVQERSIARSWGLE